MSESELIRRDEILCKSSEKRLLLTVILTAGILDNLSVLVFSPLYVITSNDIIYATTVIPELIYLVIEVCNIAVYAICHSAVIYSVYRLSFRRTGIVAMTYCAVTFLKYTGNLFVTLAFNKTIDVSDIAYVLLYFAADMLQLVIVILISCALMRSFYRRLSVIEKTGAILGKEKTTKREQIFPFGKFFDRSNPLQKASLYMGILLSVIKILTRIWYDLYYGAPGSATDFIWMIVYYLSDILTGFIAYLVSLLVLSKHDRLDESDLAAYKDSAAG